MAKICVYGVCKNEEKFVKRCIESIKDADIIVMLDTGSTDSTVELLKECGAVVHTYPINPWRFDVARNICLQYIPEDVDICVSIDLDEILEPGWREALESAWEEGTTRANYHYIWSFKEDGSPLVQFYQERIHARHGYRWIYPTHEVLEHLDNSPEKWCQAKGMVMKHYPDNSKSRSFNLELLELAVKENPTSTRNLHYLGREYYFTAHWEKCIQTLKQYLEMPTANWAEERSFAMRYIANSYKALGNILEAKSWLLKAIAEAPQMREAYVEMCKLAYEEKEWKLVCLMSKLALEIKEEVRGHYNEAFAWDETIYDLVGLGYYYTGQYQEAIKYWIEALRIAPSNARIINNLKLARNAIKY